jgi:hypothetical protein
MPACLPPSLSVCRYVKTRLPLYGFLWNWYLSVFQKLVMKIQVKWKPDKMAGTSYEDGCTIKISSRWIILGMKIFRKKCCREYQNTNYISNALFSLENRALMRYEIREKHGRARQATDGNIIWRMRIAYWVTEATDTLRICNTYCFSMSSTVARTCLNVTLYVRLYY